MRFDELVLKDADDELRVSFHPRLTVLSGLGARERQDLAERILGALTGGDHSASLHLVDGVGRAVTLSPGPRGSVQARHDDDDSAAKSPVGTLSASPEGLRALMLVQAADLSVVARPARPDEPRELREARTTLAEIGEELETALAESQEAASLQAELDHLNEQLRAAHDGAARCEYAQILSQLERVRAEAATLQSGTTGVDADRHLLSRAETLRGVRAAWVKAAAVLADAIERFGSAERLDAEELSAACSLPEAVPAELDDRIDALVEAAAHRDSLDHRLQALAVAKLPAPSDLLVGELGLLDQSLLWHSAERMVEATEEVNRVQVSLGGLGGAEGAEEPTVIADMEEAHRNLEDAARVAESMRIPGVAGTGLGVTVMLAGAIGSPLLMPVGAIAAASVGVIALLRPKRHMAAAAGLERAALDRAGASSYLGFHLRRVDATVDPNVRGTVESAGIELRAATAAWVDLVGPCTDARRALELRHEVTEYHDALRSLGGAADEIEQLRNDLATHAEPAVVVARAALADLGAMFGLDEADLQDPAAVSARVTDQIRRGVMARAQIEVEEAEKLEREAAKRLADDLRQLGFDSGDLDARLGALDWALARAAEREEARTNARPPAEIEAELESLQDAARRLRRPEWSTVTAAEAEAPDVDALQEQREKLEARIDETRVEVDVLRLADRHAAAERRVVALEARHRGYDDAGDPGLVADIQQRLLARLTKAATAGPHGDAVPAVLDDVLLRVPAERKWDLLDLLYRLSERHQILYLSDDAFVAAWARQCPDGTVMLLEPVPEVV